MQDLRDARLDETHVRPLMDIVRGLRSRGLSVPNVDPDDGGVKARALFFLETPGPRAVGTFYVSRSNPDPSARNMGKALDFAGFARSDVLIWNVVPHCVSTVDRNKNATAKQIRETAPDTQAVIDVMQSLAVDIVRAARLTFNGPQPHDLSHCRVTSY
jgi:uracil-DNA glycosylase